MAEETKKNKIINESVKIFELYYKLTNRKDKLKWIGYNFIGLFVSVSIISNLIDSIELFLISSILILLTFLIIQIQISRLNNQIISIHRRMLNI